MRKAKRVRELRWWTAATALLGALCLVAGTLLALSGPSTAVVSPTQPASTRNCPWTSPEAQATASPTQLAAQVVSKMTVAEKVAMLGLVSASQRGVENETPAIKRLCLPSFFTRDGPSGVGARASGVTYFPSEIALASTFDPALAQRMGAALGDEARRQGDLAIQGPGVDVSVFANWGRNFENLGDDPTLASVMGAAIVTGIQSVGEIAVTKHLGPYAEESSRYSVNYLASAPVLEQIYLAPFRAAVLAGTGALMCSVGSTNGVNTCSDPAIFQLLHSWGFHGVVRTDAEAVTNDVAALRAGTTLFKTLRSGQIYQALRTHQLRLGDLDQADESIVALMFAYHDIPAHFANHPNTTVASASDLVTASEVASEGTVLLKDTGVLPLTGKISKVALLGAAGNLSAIAGGSGSSAVSASDVVTPLEGLRAALPQTSVLYDAAQPTLRPARLVDTRRAPGGVSEATVVLAPETRGIVDFRLRSSGPAELLVDGRPLVTLYPATIATAYLEGEQATHVSGSTKLLVRWVGNSRPEVSLASVGDMLQRAALLARSVPVAIVDVGVRSSEGLDRTTLELPGLSNQLIDAVAAANPHTVVVLNTGGPVVMPWLGRVSAVLEAWYPGQTNGTALGQVLTGQVDPSGKLPMVFGKSAKESPMVPLGPWPKVPGVINLNAMGLDVGEHWYSQHRVTPLFPFGYGLSYTRFRLSDLTAAPEEHAELLRVRVTNVGRVAGRDVVEAYLSFPTVAEPTDQLAGFASVELGAGQSSEVTIHLPASAFARWIGKGFAVARGQYLLKVSSSSTDPGLTARVTAPTLACAQPCLVP